MIRKSGDSIVVENARIGFRNFEGKEGQYNPPGNRNFALFIDDVEFANELQKEGWNIKWLKPKSEDDEPAPFMQIKVAFGNYPPKIISVSNGKKTQLNEETISILDWADIESVDLVARPYNYSVRGASGIKAYLKTMYVTFVTDEFAKKYEDENANDSDEEVVIFGNIDSED